MGKFEAFQFGEVLFRDDALRINLIVFEGPDLLLAAAVTVDEVDAFGG